MIPVWIKVWGLRILFFAGLVGLCTLVGSNAPAFGFALAWGPNGLFLYAYSKGLLQLPRILEPVKPVEPVLYRWAGVGFVKSIVETSMWPRLVGFEPPARLRSRRELLARAEYHARSAEICHAATFIVAFVVAVFFHTTGRIAEAVWIHVFNVLLNAYPVMLQRVHRWRIQRIRAQVL